MTSQKKKKKTVDSQLTIEIKPLGIIIRNHFNYEKITGECNDGTIITVPDQAMTVLDILNRHTSGRDVPQLEPNYQYESDVEHKDTLDLPDLEKLSKTDALYEAQEIKTYRKEKSSHIKNLHTKIKKGITALKTKSKQQKKPSETSEANEHKGDKPQYKRGDSKDQL